MKSIRFVVTALTATIAATVFCAGAASAALPPGAVTLTPPAPCTTPPTTSPCDTQPAGNRIRICWANPTTREDQTPFPRSELKEIRFYADGSTKPFLTAVGQTVDDMVIEYTMQCYREGRRIEATAVDINGLTSKRSAPAYLAAKPGTTCR